MNFCTVQQKKAIWFAGIFLLVFASVILTGCKNKVKERKYPKSNYSVYCRADRIQRAFDNQDSVYINEMIDSLEYFDYPAFSDLANNLSLTTGFGCFLIDPNDEIFSSKSYDTNRILKKNIIISFNVYRKSKLFMKPMQIIMIRYYFYFDDVRLLNERELNGMMNFTNDCGDNFIVVQP